MCSCIRRLQECCSGQYACTYVAKHVTCVVYKVSALLDDSKKQEFFEEVTEEYEDLRDEHYQSLKVVLQLYDHIWTLKLFDHIWY